MERREERKVKTSKEEAEIDVMRKEAIEEKIKQCEEI